MYSSLAGGPRKRSVARMESSVILVPGGLWAREDRSLVEGCMTCPGMRSEKVLIESLGHHIL